MPEQGKIRCQRNLDRDMIYIDRAPRFPNVPQEVLDQMVGLRVYCSKISSTVLTIEGVVSVDFTEDLRDYMVSLEDMKTALGSRCPEEKNALRNWLESQGIGCPEFLLIPPDYWSPA
jgi:hypothetical protein